MIPSNLEKSYHVKYGYVFSNQRDVLIENKIIYAYL